MTDYNKLAIKVRTNLLQWKMKSTEEENTEAFQKIEELMKEKIWDYRSRNGINSVQQTSQSHRLCDIWKNNLLFFTYSLSRFQLGL